jgi:uncharacterized protein YciI
MLYMITGRDVPGSLAIRRRVRSAHLARIQKLVEAGRIVLAGPIPAIDAKDPADAGYAGSLIVGEFESLEAAREWIATDPYVTSGVFESFEVRPFVKVLP